MVFLERLTRFERARLISARALQLSLGAPPLLKVEKTDSMIEIAEKEFEGRVLPLAVNRRYPDGTVKRIELN